MASGCFRPPDPPAIVCNPAWTLLCHWGLHRPFWVSWVGGGTWVLLPTHLQYGRRTHPHFCWLAKVLQVGGVYAEWSCWSLSFSTWGALLLASQCPLCMGRGCQGFHHPSKVLQVVVWVTDHKQSVGYWDHSGGGEGQPMILLTAEVFQVQGKGGQGYPQLLRSSECKGRVTDISISC